MNDLKSSNWERFKKYVLYLPELGLSLDYSRMMFPDRFLIEIEPGMKKALAAMKELEAGTIANPDEDRMVGHYWLRDARLAPNKEMTQAIEETHTRVKAFAKAVIEGKIKGNAGKFERALIVGIGGSALGPQLVSKALSKTGEGLKLCFLDNTDPDGMDVVFRELKGDMDKTLVVVISKSGGTKETRNGMLETKATFEGAGIDFESIAVAITGDGSELDLTATKGGWLARFPMWDWIGGRTSELSAVGLLPAALQGIDTDALLAGAAAVDIRTREEEWRLNPAALMAAMWNYAGNGKGEKDLVVLPYKDRLELFSKYLQQLIMESLGKELDVDGRKVNQGLAVYGNKGSTDQHAYVQQLRDGIHNFFVTFIRVLKDRNEAGIEVEKGISSGDYLNGFLLGTRTALSESDRESMMITIGELNAFSLGGLIALFERAVGLYASLVNINAYHQPGVEAGKKAAVKVIDQQARVLELLRQNGGTAFTAEEIAEALAIRGEEEALFLLGQHLSSNARFDVKVTRMEPFWKSEFTSRG